MGKLPVKDKLIYGVGAFGYGSVNQTFGNFLMFFGTAVLGLSGTLMGLVIGISTIWDGLTDPLVGSLSDNCGSKRFGKRHGFMLTGCLCIAVLNIAIWSINPSWSQYTKFFVLLLALLLVETFNTIYATPYGALGVDMAKTYDDRTSIQNYKTAFQFCSLLVPSVLMTVFLTPENYLTINATSTGYTIISFVTSLLCIITGFITIFGTKHYINRRIYAKTKHFNLHTIIRNFFSILKEKNIFPLIIAYTISLSAGAVITGIGMHVFTYTFHFSSLQIPIILTCLVLGIILGQPLWYKISCRYDKKQTIFAAIATIAAGAVIFSFLMAIRVYIPKYLLVPTVSVIVAVISCGVGCLYSMPISMFGDCIYKNKDEKATDNTAMAMGFLTFCTKISNAIIMFIIGVVLDMIGFNGSSGIQTPAVNNLLGLVLVLGVTVPTVISWFFYKKYNYSKNNF
jgi:Na+/melibiose symporter-like transporter